MLAPLSVLQSVHQSPPDPPGHWRRPLALRLRAASRDQWEPGTGVGTDWSLMSGRGDTTDSVRVVGSLSREIITRYNIISLSHNQPWAQEQTSNPIWSPSSTARRGSWLGSRFCGRNFKMFELSGWRKIWRLWLEGGDGSVWMGEDLCLLKLKMFYRFCWSSGFTSGENWIKTKLIYTNDKVAIIEWDQLNTKLAIMSLFMSSSQYSDTDIYVISWFLNWLGSMVVVEIIGIPTNYRDRCWLRLWVPFRPCLTIFRHFLVWRWGGQWEGEI